MHRKRRCEIACKLNQGPFLLLDPIKRSQFTSFVVRYALRQLLAVLVVVAVLVGAGPSVQALEHSFVADAVQLVAPGPDRTRVLIPITWPSPLTKGPPELPGLMAASV